MANAKKVSRKIARRPDRKAAARKRPARPAASVAITRTETVIVTARSTRRAVTSEAIVSPAIDMTPTERDRIQNWFDETRKALRALARDIDAEMAASSTGRRKDALQKIMGNVISDEQILNLREEAFFASDSSQTIKPPSNADIEETRRLSLELGKAIAEQRTLEAIVKLANDLSGLALQLSSPTDAAG